MARALEFALIAAGVVLGAYTAWHLKPEAAARPVSSAPDTVLIRERPTVKQTLRQKLTHGVVKPAETVSSAGAPDTAALRRFCELAERPARGMDSLKIPAESLNAATDGKADFTPPTPQLLPSAGRYDGKALALFSTRSDGSVLEERFNVRAPFDWAQDSVHTIVHGPRFWLRAVQAGKDCGKGAVLGAAGGVIAGWLGGLDVVKSAVIGAGGACLGSAF